MGEGPGRPTELTDEMVGKIKKGILDGLMLKEIAKENGILENTLYNWSAENYLNIKDKMEVWRLERLLNLANKNHEDILKKGVEDKEVLKVVADMTKFTLETLDKENFTKRLEQTGKDGGPIETKTIITNDEGEKLLNVFRVQGSNTAPTSGAVSSDVQGED